MLYPQETIEQVLEASNIVDIISEYVKLNKKGSTYFGLCPFHNEKTPSFSVSDSNGRKMFYCFGCHTGGNVITFLMKYENYTYTEALKVLADRAGITLPKPEYSREDSEKARRREQILEVYKEAAVYYYHLLKSPRGQQAYQYLKNRQLSDETILKFGLGYSDKYRDDLYRYVKSKGYTDEVLKETGLFSIRETDVHDYFWNRVMFPIMDTRNKVIAFGGRVMGEGEPKYLNSPETAIFEKRKTLFGLNTAKKHKGNELILCEGYMDVISLHQAGFTNAVASLGTALTPSHAAVLKRYTSGVVLSYDSDGAGRNAAVRAIPILKNAGLSVRVIRLDPYKDPDELIKAEGTESYRKRLKEARNGLLFEIDVLSESFDLTDPEGQTAFYHETARRLSYLEDEIERENYLKTIASQFRLDQKLLKDRTIRLVLNRDSGRTCSSVPTQPPARRPEKKEPAGLLESQKTVLAYLAEHPGFLEKTGNILSPEDFTPGLYRDAAELLFAQIRQGRISISGIIGSFSDEESQEQVADIFRPGQPPADEGEYRKLAADSIILIRQHSLEQQMEKEQDVGRLLELKKEQENLRKCPFLFD